MPGKNNKLSLSAIILAGGKSSRIGFNKIRLKIGKVPLFIDQMVKLSFFCSEFIVSTSKTNQDYILKEIRDIREYEKLYDIKSDHRPLISAKNIKIELDEDLLEGIGPITGIYAGLEASSNKWSLVTAFDMPFLSFDLLSLLILRKKTEKKDISPYRLKKPFEVFDIDKDARILKRAKGFESLCGLYSKRCIAVIKENIEKSKYKISDIYPRLNIDYIYESEIITQKIDETNFLNINTISQYRLFENIWQKAWSMTKKDSFKSAWDYLFFR
jgi:molybdenum cofactor guanylyltransferase